jgi:predicted DNA repair protein MutK
MFLVGGGILAHGIPGLESWFHRLGQGMGAVSEVLLPMLLNAVVGILAGAVVFAVVSLVKRMAK